MSEEQKEKKRAAQAAAWKRWYLSPKGQAYKLKRKMMEPKEPAK